MSDASPKISVIMTYYNEHAFIAEAFVSVAAQTALDAIVEVIVVDDGSEPESAAKLDCIAGEYPMVKVLHIRNRGLSGARNVAFEHARAPFVAILDGDDVWHREKIALQIAQIARSGDRVGLWYGDFRQFQLAPAQSIAARVRKFSESDEDTLPRFFVCDGPIIPSTVILRTAAFKAVGGFNEQIALFEDQDMWLRIAAGGWKFQYVPGAMLYKRFHEGSLAQSRFEKWEAAFFRLEQEWTARRPDLLPYLGKRRSWRYARLANTALLRGASTAGWKYLARACRANPFNPRVYAYCALAMIPARARSGLVDSFKRFLRGVG
jgi:glycosyltransferase involved in cell wall biosynthesis